MYDDGRYGRLNPDWHDRDAPHKARVVADLLRAAGLSAGAVLDVGCGTGRVVAELDAELGSAWGPWEGWDPAPEAIARAASLTTDRRRFVCGDALDAASSRDWVLALDVVEHVADDADFLRRLSRLAPHAVLRVPLELSVWDVLRPRRRLAARQQLGHLHAYDLPALRALLAEAGWQVRDLVWDRVPFRATGPGALSDGVRRLWARRDPERAARWLGGYSVVVLASRSSSSG